ncbi:DUF998 domain-containing protein [Algoriphagus resistens]|uniref:DUF998 domain-containing protein n=1 Tax=Algoriphagus resistens TaxID=1750590 RepID=UPI000716929F|nr:DUF998 domain-containing protein [Algoriphagus resistens]
MNALKVSKISAIGFIGILLIHHIVNPDINPGWQPISMYALGKLGWLMNIAFILLGVSFLALGIYLFKNVQTSGAKIGGIFLVIAAIGNFLAGIFNTDPVDTLPEQMTTSGSIHAGAAGLLAFFIIATIFISFQFLKRGNLKPFKVSVLAMTGLVLIAEIVVIAAMGIYLAETNGMLTPETPIGGLGRVVIIACTLWVIVTSTSLGKAHSQTNFQ